jgi:DHA2 family multidrug resistance protein-like MFS transporter
MGGTILAFGLAAAALWQPYDDPLPLVGFIMLCGVGFGIFNVPNNHSMFLSVSSDRSGAAGGMQGTARLVGQTAGAVIMTLLFTVGSAEMAPRIALGIGAVLTLLAGGVSVLRVEPRAAPTGASYLQ